MTVSATPSANALRRAADDAHLDALVARAGGRIRVLARSDRPGMPIRLAIACRTVGSSAYPSAAQDDVRLRIDLPARYPFERPVITVESPIFHPNVFTNGTICQGEKWLPGDGLDILLQRIIRLVTFEPSHVNPASAANRVAANWYLSRRREAPDAFPTDRLVLTDPPARSGERVLRQCPACGTGLRLPAGRSGVVACPRCRAEFDVTTREG